MPRSLNVMSESRHVISNNVAFWRCVGSGEPVQPCFKLINSKWFSVSSLIFI